MLAGIVVGQGVDDVASVRRVALYESCHQEGK